MVVDGLLFFNVGGGRGCWLGVAFVSGDTSLASLLLLLLEQLG